MLGLWLALSACTEDPVDASPTSPSVHDSTTSPTEPYLPEVPGAEPADRGALLFGSNEPIDVQIAISNEDYDALADEPTAWVPATLRVDGYDPIETGVRLKGNGSFQPITAKSSFKLDIDRYVPGQHLDGLDELVLNNMVSDASGMRERTAYAVYRELGVPAPRTRHATVTVRGEDKGTYLLLEDVDGRFLNRWFDYGNGPLFEVFDTDLTPEGIELLDHDGGPDDRSVLQALAEVLQDPDAKLTEEGAEFLDIDSFVAYFGASGAIAQFDAYPYSVPGDDVYLYVNPETGKIHILPHGGDETFRDENRPADYVFGLLGVRCLEDAVCEERFDAAVWHTVDVMEAMELPDQIRAWADAVGDMGPDPTLVEFDQNGVIEFIETRRDRIAEMPGIQ